MRWLVALLLVVLTSPAHARERVAVEADQEFLGQLTPFRKG